MMIKHAYARKTVIKLRLYGLDFGVEALQCWMVGAGVWVLQKNRHQPRAPRDCFGEFVLDRWLRAVETIEF